jgi:hypothetical protein
MHFLWEVSLCLPVNGEVERGKVEKKCINLLVQVVMAKMTNMLELITPALLQGTCHLLTMHSCYEWFGSVWHS